MSISMKTENKIDIEVLNKDIELFPQVHPITEDMKITHKGVSRLVMLDRYAFKDTEKKTLREGDFVVLTVKPDPKFPARGFGYVQTIDWDEKEATIQVDSDFISVLDGEEADTGIIQRGIAVIDKTIECFYESFAQRYTTWLARV